MTRCCAAHAAVPRSKALPVSHSARQIASPMHHELSCAWLPGSAFTRDLAQQPEQWFDSKSYCEALEPLLRLAARNPQRFSDLTGEEGKAQVTATSLH